MSFSATRRVLRDLMPTALRAFSRPNALRQFRRDARGSATLEYVLWLPVFVTILGLAADVSLTFHTHSRMWDAARDVARRTAMGQLTATQAQQVAAARLPAGGDYTVKVDDTDPQDVVVTISARSADLGLTGALDLITDGPVESVFRMRKETWNG